MLVVAFSAACDEKALRAEPADYLLRFSASDATARTSCEGDGFSGVADIYLRTEILHASAGDDTFTSLRLSDYRLIELARGEYTNAGLPHSSAHTRIEHGDQVMFAVDGYENDPGGRTAERSREFVYEYDGFDQCWWNTADADARGDAACVELPLHASWGEYEFFHVYDDARLCIVRVLVYGSFQRFEASEATP